MLHRVRTSAALPILLLVVAAGLGYSIHLGQVRSDHLLTAARNTAAATQLQLRATQHQLAERTAQLAAQQPEPTTDSR